MPELPEVETVCRGLARELVGRVVRDLEVYETRLREPVLPSAIRRDVVGRRVVRVSRRAKYIVVDLEAGRRTADAPTSLLVHLGMSGVLSVHASAEARAPHTHLVWRLDDGRELRLRDPRRFGLALSTRTSALARHPRLRDLGVEPLSTELRADRVFERTRRRKRPVKAFLMDASEVVGIGNIYACEALHRAGVHPGRAVGRIGRERWERIVESVQGVLREAIAHGGTTLNDYRDAHGDEGAMQQRLQVYGREGAPCLACGRAVLRRVHSGRSTYFCPTCQR